jgi:hypothetical protein
MNLLAPARAEGLLPESRQEFQRIYGLSPGPLTSPPLTQPAQATPRSGLQAQSAEEFKRVFGQNALSGSVALQSLSTPQTINSTNLCGVLDSADKRKYVILWHLISMDLCLSNNAAERGLRGIAKLESLCNPSSSVCKHWKHVFVGNATRATLSGDRGFDAVAG